MLSVRAKVKGNSVKILDRIRISEEKEYPVLVTFLSRNVTAFDDMPEKDILRILSVKRFRLSEWEVQVLRLLQQGLNNKQLAEKLELADASTRNLLTRIYGKLQVTNRTSAVVKAMEYGVLD